MKTIVRPVPLTSYLAEPAPAAVDLEVNVPVVNVAEAGPDADAVSVGSVEAGAAEMLQVRTVEQYNLYCIMNVIRFIFSYTPRLFRCQLLRFTLTLTVYLNSYGCLTTANTFLTILCRLNRAFCITGQGPTSREIQSIYSSLHGEFHLNMRGKPAKYIIIRVHLHLMDFGCHTQGCTYVCLKRCLLSFSVLTTR